MRLTRSKVADLRSAGEGNIGGSHTVVPPLVDRATADGSVDIRMLGPISITLRGESIMPTAGKPRQLLVLLALRYGQVVPVSTLMEELWGDVIPRSGMTTLQTYVMQLRRLIGGSLPADSQRVAKELLVTRFNGYQLMATPRSWDLHEFERLAADGETALDLGDAVSASKYLGQALDLWRGPALADVPTGRMLATEAIGMEEARMRVHQRRIVADFSLGKHDVVIPELRMLVVQNPMHENFCALLMIALQRSGAAWRALEVFRNLRTTLIEEFGVEPSGRLQELHQAVLSNTPELSLRSYGLV
ncbi:AfsR/SARP family transcriptional regulator [Saccharopolyspora phatthalungensis]|uniref:DNA-binding SARP family transcriptional activator n=1 Tax=Saccharopolyspora phatthalungensis TaxID=664693 RepID=A0A840QE68_9PSEU|nr:AfsR/SARP family transcriptional regulator [Saccharopolyspora phatthalungensis]MBB5156869.1 DNA-binding SARP family transcriptional activator [Saccharopolyspora phatthalungensis]